MKFGHRISKKELHMKKFSARVLIVIAILLLLVVAGIGLLLSFKPALPTPAAAPTPSLLTTKLVVDTSKLSDYPFEVPSNTNLTLSSKDAKEHTCTINSSPKITLNIPAGSFATFKLDRGTYKLNCGIRNIDATIESK
jgi:hypothetical protein